MESLKQIDFYPTILRALKNHMDNDSEASSILDDASNAFITITMESKLLAWQNNTAKQYRDFALTWNDLANKAEWLEYSNMVVRRQV